MRPELHSEILEILAAMDRSEDVRRFLMDLLTPSEVESLSERWAIVRALAEGKTQRSVRDELGVSVTTVSRGSRQLKYGEGGFELALNLLEGRVA